MNIERQLAVIHLKQLCSKNNHRSCSISNFFVLEFSQLNKYLRVNKDKSYDQNTQVT